LRIYIGTRSARAATQDPLDPVDALKEADESGDMWEDASADEVERAAAGEEGKKEEEEEEEEEEETTRNARDERIPAHLRPPSKLPPRPRPALLGSPEGGPLVKRSPAAQHTHNAALHTQGDETVEDVSSPENIISYKAADARERLPAAVLSCCVSCYASMLYARACACCYAQAVGGHTGRASIHARSREGGLTI